MGKPWAFISPRPGTPPSWGPLSLLGSSTRLGTVQAALQPSFPSALLRRSGGEASPRRAPLSSLLPAGVSSLCLPLPFSLSLEEATGQGCLKHRGNLFHEKSPAWELGHLDLKPGSASDLLCELGQVPSLSGLPIPIVTYTAAGHEDYVRSGGAQHIVRSPM